MVSSKNSGLVQICQTQLQQGNAMDHVTHFLSSIQQIKARKEITLMSFTSLKSVKSFYSDCISYLLPFSQSTHLRSVSIGQPFRLIFLK